MRFIVFGGGLGLFENAIERGAIGPSSVNDDCRNLFRVANVLDRIGAKQDKIRTLAGFH